MKDELQKPLLTIGVLTMNEAHRIAVCLQSASFADQVIVVDSGSTDDTVSIARQMGAEVFSYPDWQGFAVQRNRLLQHAKGKYIFFLDADEVINDSCRKEIEAVTQSGEDAVWKIKWRIVAFGHELKYLKSTAYVERLFLRDNIKEFQGVVHEKAHLRNPHVKRYLIKNAVLHSSRESIQSSLNKMTQYVMLGALKRSEQRKKGGVCRGLLSGFTIFFRLYFLHRGFMCGGAGFLYAIFHALEAFFRYAALEYDRDSLKFFAKR